jgi:hypothetical protein
MGAALGVPLYEVPPKLWQMAILGRDPKNTSAVDYDGTEYREDERLINASFNFQWRLSRRSVEASRGG